MNKTTYITITLWLIIFSSANAQTRKIYVKESLVYSYTTNGYHPGIIIIKDGGDSIIVTKRKSKTEYDVQYWSSVYKGDTVYIDEFSLTQIVEENKIIERKKEIADSLVKRKFLIKKYGFKMGSFISDGYIKRGMTKQQAKLSWGEPNQIHRTVFSGGVHEQWVYNNNQYLYFENGILTAWQD